MCKGEWRRVLRVDAAAQEALVGGQTDHLLGNPSSSQHHEALFAQIIGALHIAHFVRNIVGGGEFTYMAWLVLPSATGCLTVKATERGRL